MRREARVDGDGAIERCEAAAHGWWCYGHGKGVSRARLLDMHTTVPVRQHMRCGCCSYLSKSRGGILLRGRCEDMQAWAYTGGRISRHRLLFTVDTSHRVVLSMHRYSTATMSFAVWGIVWRCSQWRCIGHVDVPRTAPQPRTHSRVRDVYFTQIMKYV